MTVGAPLGLIIAYLVLGPDAPTTADLIAAGAKVDDDIAAGQWWRLVSAGALHAGPIHVSLNSALLAFGFAAWSRLGRTSGDEGLARALGAVALAVLSSAIGFTASFVVRAGPSVGASGAALGVLAAVVMGVWRRRPELPQGFRTRGPVALGAAFVAVLVASSCAGGVDHACHLGGSVGGLLLAPLVDRPSRSRSIVVLATTLLIVGALVLALTGDRSPGT